MNELIDGDDGRDCRSPYHLGCEKCFPPEDRCAECHETFPTDDLISANRWYPKADLKICLGCNSEFVEQEINEYKFTPQQEREINSLINIH